MADFEDGRKFHRFFRLNSLANSPTWENNIDGQFNLRDAVNKTISFTANDKVYKLNEKHAVLLVRPRGEHFPQRF